MSSGCGDVLSLEDLRIAKLHQLFEAEVITGRSGGVAGGAAIDYATNQVTGQIQKTLPAVLRDAGFNPASFDFTTGGVLGADDRDVVVFDPVSKTWYSWLGALPHTIPAETNPVGNADWKPQTDPDLRLDLASTSSASKGPGIIGYNKSLSYAANTVGAALNDLWSLLPQINIKNYASLKDAIAVLAPFGGGTVFVPAGAWSSGHWNTSASGNMSTDNIRILGERMPICNNSLSKLTGGSVIKDRFIACANNLWVENIGFDAGKDVIDALYPGANTTTASHPDTGTWDAFVFGAPAAGVAQKRNLIMRNVVGLMYNSAAIGHAVLTEAYTGGRLDNIIGIYGYHGVIIKANDVVATSIYSYGQSMNGLIIKADGFSDCGNVKVHDHYHAQKPRGTTPWSAPAVALHALDLDTNAASFSGSVYIGYTASSGAKWHVHVGGLVPLADVHLANISTDGIGLDGSVVGEYSYIVEGSTTASRISIGALRVSNCTNGVYLATPSANPQQTHINSLRAVNISGQVVRVLDNARLVIDALDAWSIGSLYFITQLGKVYVGSEQYTAMTGAKFATAGGGSAPALAGGWVQSDGNELFEFCLKNYRAVLRGSIASGTSAAMVSLPIALRPSLPVRRTMMGIVSGNLVSFPCSIVDTVRTYDGTLPSGINFASLSGIEWDY